MDSSSHIKKPAYRRLRGFAFDPSLSFNADTAYMNDIVFNVPWEDIKPGPSGEYVEVVDYDPTLERMYKAVDLDHLYIVAQDGLDPSESNPQFHQQMVYTVAMITIRNFEMGLGRKINWAPRFEEEGKREIYVPQLRLYPHAMREANAYYSPLKHAILFGYFYSMPSESSLQLSGIPVFTCLSHDIIAHEVTHAILDSIHKDYHEASNPDVLAFHEAFADIVALFQHFSFPEALRHQISRTQGDLSTQNLLGQLAQEFGTATGKYGSLRDAIGTTDPETMTWKPNIPNPHEYRQVMEPHARGSILVAAVFEAFLTMYKTRTADLWRIATNGTGIWQGELQPDLVARLAEEASQAAAGVLMMCIRALDYCPPLDITFGDFLCGIITADIDANRNFNRAARMAFISAFRKRGIYPQNIRSLNEESLRYPVLNISTNIQKSKQTTGDKLMRLSGDSNMLFSAIGQFVFEYAHAVQYLDNRKDLFFVTRNFIYGSGDANGSYALHQRLRGICDSASFARITGLAFIQGFEMMGIHHSSLTEGPHFRIARLELISRASQDAGQLRHSATGAVNSARDGAGPGSYKVNHAVISLVQHCGVVFRNGKFDCMFTPDKENMAKDTQEADGQTERFIFRGGCTLIFDLDTSLLKYAICKPIVSEESVLSGGRPEVNQRRIAQQYQYRQAKKDNLFSEYQAFFGDDGEQFALLHKD